MNIQVRTDNNIEGSEELNQFIETSLLDSFQRFSGAITRIEVHLADENGSKNVGDDKRCTLEARVANHSPVVVTHHSDSIHRAFEAASHKLLTSLDKMAAKLTTRDSVKNFSAETETENEFEEED
ncbi:MAG: hypothetical protein CME71_06870 [Halobacteriovorax sp.]|nr:hypothetical protein [Halobacteriovorax sp.]|tara:strand:+ start:392 stop:766 length:375 start_codon:yes stop_codon:yes gene_type:complete